MGIKNLDEKSALKIIIDAAKSYEQHLCNKHFLIIYRKDGNFFYASVCFNGRNFLHLTGVRTQLTPRAFYQACLKNKLSIRDIDLNTKGKAQQKLAVLPFLKNLFNNHCLIGRYSTNGIYLEADYFLGDTKFVLSLGFRNQKTYDVPVTLYKESIRKMADNTYKVMAIYRKEKSKAVYSTATYRAKDYDVSQIKDLDVFALIESEN